MSSLPNFTDAQIGRLEALRSSLQRTDRVMAESRTVSLKFDYQKKGNKTPAPAYLTGEHITVCLGWIADPSSQEGLVHILGLNAHELAHYLYSVGVKTLEKRWTEGNFETVNTRFDDAYRILEDQRIETLMSAKYRRTEKYFSYPVIAHMVNDRETWPSAFLLTHGRRYLPKTVRTMFRTIFEDGTCGPDTNAFADLIDQYRVLSFTTIPAQEQATQIINDFAKLLDKNQVPGSGMGDDHPKASMTMASAETDEDVRLAVLMTEIQDDEDQHGAQSLGGGDGDDDGSGKGQNDQDGGNAGNDGGDTDGSSQKPGSGASKSGGVNEKELGEELEDVIAAVLLSQEIVNDLRDLQRAMDDRTAGMTSILDRIQTTPTSVTLDMMEESARMQNELRRLWASLDPGWVWDQPDGRVDMNRAALAREPEDYEHIYTSWDEGQQENSGVEGVVLLDFSESMLTRDNGRMSRIQSASQAVWEVKNALQEIEASVTVLAYNNGCYSLYDRDQTVQKGSYDLIRASGGTEPSAALQEARRILNVSQCRNKLLVAVTDGEWWAGKEYDGVLLSTDAVKLAVLIGPVKFDYAKYFDIVTRVSEARQIFPAVGSTVTRMIERNAR